MTPQPNLPDVPKKKTDEEEREARAAAEREKRREEQRRAAMDWLRLLPEWLRGKLP